MLSTSTKGIQIDAVYNAFRRCVRAEPEDFFNLTFFDEIPQIHGEVGNQSAHNPSRWLLWQDPLLGLFDANIRGLALDEHYHEQAVRMHRAAERNQHFHGLFTYYQLAAEVLAKKATLGLELYDAYQVCDRETLKELADERIPALCEAIERLYESHCGLWHKTSMQEGWEVFDLRYGGLIARLKTTRRKVNSYLAGETSTIPELTRERLLYNAKEGLCWKCSIRPWLQQSHL